MEIVDYNFEIQNHTNIINNCLTELADIDNKDIQKSFGTLRKINLQKKYIRELNNFRDLQVELYKKNDGIYAFFIFGQEYNYAIKSKKVRRPGSQSWDIIRQKTLESILDGKKE